jgi:hypothetical protein
MRVKLNIKAGNLDSGCFINISPDDNNLDGQGLYNDLFRDIKVESVKKIWYFMGGTIVTLELYRGTPIRYLRKVFRDFKTGDEYSMEYQDLVKTMYL